MSDGNDFLMGGGIPSAKFAIKGATLRGYVTAYPDTRAQTDMATKEVKRYTNGDVMMQVVVKVQTDERDDTMPHDDGVRATYIKGQNIRRLREAIRATGAKGLEPGGYLVQTYVRDEAPTGGLPQGAKVHEFQYTPPNATDARSTEVRDNGFSDAVKPASNIGGPTTPPPAARPLPPSVAAELNEDQRRALAQLGYQVQ